LVRFSGLFRGFVILLCAFALQLAHDHTMGNASCVCAAPVRTVEGAAGCNAVQQYSFVRRLVGVQHPRE
jgi:hypothetical protein